MGNSTSNANNSNANNNTNSRLDSRTNSPIRGGSPNPSSHRVHKSLRTKKKSLELPDLASLALTPASSSPSSVSPHANYRRPRASSPIPIPIPASANAPQQTFRPQNNLPSAAHIHINHVPSRQGYRSGRYKSFADSSAYPSTHSLSAADQGSPPRQEPPKPEFIPEIVHSTLPLVLIKPEEDASKQEPLTVIVKWRCGGRNVVLARAGDDHWKGRQQMDYDQATNSWRTPVRLFPGTHHFKFIVDDQWRIADDYPTAVDDRDGSLANYVNVLPPTASSSPRTPGYVSPLASPHHNHPNQFNSFWSDSTSGDVSSGSATLNGGGYYKGEADWTTTIPPELIQAAAEEENYLASADSPASSSSVPTPNIPPAPVLPRHLDKLILNVRPAAVTGASSASGSPSASTSAERDRTRRSGSRQHKRDRESRSARPTSNLGMTATTSEPNIPSGSGAEGLAPTSITLPVVTASGTDVTAQALAASCPPTPLGDSGTEGGSGLPSSRKVAVAKLDGPGLADDASVLPVPSHVVLHHLSTSAIRNGVLAVANTTRYRKKGPGVQYITTIYYKPTSASD